MEEYVSALERQKEEMTRVLVNKDTELEEMRDRANQVQEKMAKKMEDKRVEEVEKEV
jgi:hypothetical protein